MVAKQRKTMRSNPLDAIRSETLDLAKSSTVAQRISDDSASQIEAQATVLEAQATALEAEITVLEAQATVLETETTVLEAEATVLDAQASVAQTPAISTAVACGFTTEETAAKQPVLQTAADIFDAERSWTREKSVAIKLVDGRNHDATEIVKKWSQWSVAASLIPVPVVDTLAISGTQIKMIHALCACYGVPFRRERAVAVATGLLGGAATTTIAHSVTRVLVKSIPFVGPLFALTAEPALSFATTYGIGQAFIKHFESEGTLDDFSAKQMKYYVDAQFAKGKQIFKKSQSPGMG